MVPDVTNHVPATSERLGPLPPTYPLKQISLVHEALLILHLDSPRSEPLRKIPSSLPHADLPSILRLRSVVHDRSPFNNNGLFTASHHYSLQLAARTPILAPASFCTLKLKQLPCDVEIRLLRRPRSKRGGRASHVCRHAGSPRLCMLSSVAQLSCCTAVALQQICTGQVNDYLLLVLVFSACAESASERKC